MLQLASENLLLLSARRWAEHKTVELVVVPWPPVSSCKLRIPQGWPDELFNFSREGLFVSIGLGAA